jgi:stage V sporulation protein G
VQISEVRIKLMDEPSERLQAFCSITFDDCFVIRDLKIIEGSSGPFVAMPSRKLTSHCPNCGCKNHLRAAHCNQCGGRLKEDRAVKDSEGRAKLYADIAHPINSACREMIQTRVIEEFHLEQDRAKQPGYVSRYDDFDLDYDAPESAPRPATQTKIEPAHAPQPPHKTAASAQQPALPHGQTRRTDSAATAPAPHTSPESAGAKANANGTGPKNTGFGAGVF